MKSINNSSGHCEFSRWLNHPQIDQKTFLELKELKDPNEIRDRFGNLLSFGTAGLCGLIGAGTSRMNRYVIRRATQGFVQFLLKTDPLSLSQGIVIAYDTRLNSLEFAHEAARVLLKYGIITYIFKDFCPSPILSFAIRYLRAAGGIIITASHNSYEYSGYKVYGADGAQLLPEYTDQIYDEMKKINDEIGQTFPSIEDGVKKGLIRFIGDEILQSYLKKLGELRLQKFDDDDNHRLKVLFTPLHGSGNKPVRDTLNKLEYVRSYVVHEQEKPDPFFLTVDVPDPAKFESFEMALETAEKNEIDLIVGTDPDADRVGLLVKKNRKYRYLTGNQIGVLLSYYLLEQKKPFVSGNSVILKSIVTTELVRKIASYYGVCTIDLLPGFKYFAAKIKELEKQRQITFLMGFEESNGYLLGDFVREKDAMQAIMLICEMAMFYKKQGYSLIDILARIFSRFGFYRNELITFSFEGFDSREKMKKKLKELHTRFLNHAKEIQISEVMDYQLGLYDLPAADVLKVKLVDGSWIAIRPSGTEPKIKCYIETVGRSELRVKEKLEQLKVFIYRLAYK